jgi:hypothetical protein
MLKLPRYYEMWFLMKLKDWYVLKCVQDYEPKHCQHLETLINVNPSHEHNEKKWAMMMMSNNGTYIINIYNYLWHVLENINDNLSWLKPMHWS